MSVFERYVSTITDAEERQNRWFFYGQDQWKATRKLTVNYGLRWEIYRPQTVTGPGRAASWTWTPARCSSPARRVSGSI